MGAEGKTPLRDALSRQMSAPHFPVDLTDLGAFIKWREVKLGVGFEVGEAKIRAAKLNHPGGVTAYRIEHRGRVLVYATDTEHYACVDPVLLQLAKLYRLEHDFLNVMRFFRRLQSIAPADAYTQSQIAALVGSAAPRSLKPATV